MKVWTCLWCSYGNGEGDGVCGGCACVRGEGNPGEGGERGWGYYGE